MTRQTATSWAPLSTPSAPQIIESSRFAAAGGAGEPSEAASIVPAEWFVAG